MFWVADVVGGGRVAGVIHQKLRQAPQRDRVAETVFLYQTPVDNGFIDVHALLTAHEYHIAVGMGDPTDINLADGVAILTPVGGAGGLKALPAGHPIFGEAGLGHMEIRVERAAPSHRGMAISSWHSMSMGRGMAP